MVLSYQASSDNTYRLTTSSSTFPLLDQYLSTMTLTGMTCLVKATVSIMPFWLLMGVLGASLFASLIFLLVAMKHWICDLGKYGILFPYVWAACFIVLVLATLLDKNASVVPDDSRGWYSYVIMVGVTLCFSLVTYCGFFLFLCFLEAVSHHFRKFFLLWILAFVIIAIMVYVTQTMEEGHRSLYELKWSKLKFWGENDDTGKDICFLTSTPRDGDCIDMRKCKSPAIY